VHLGVNQLADRSLADFGRKNVDIDDDRLDMPAERTASAADLFLCQSCTILNIRMIGNAGGRRLGDRQIQQNGLTCEGRHARRRTLRPP
jgi:hypothetical protein